MNEMITGPYETYILEETFGKFLARLGKEETDTPAICWFDRRGERHLKTYGDIYSDSQRAAGWIHEMGYQGTRIGLSMDSSYEWFLAFFGIILSGNTAVLMDPSAEEARYGELSYIVRDVDSGEPFLFEAEPEDPAVIIYTSGTTGEPKGVELSHRGILLNAYESNLYIDDRGHRYVPLPFYHAYALTCGALSAFSSRSILYLSSKESRIGRDFQLADPYTVILVPMVLEFLKRYLKEDLRVCSMVCGGAPLSGELKQWYEKRGISIYQGYGITECSPLVSVNGERGNAAGSAGVPLPSVHVEIEETTGEIIVSGPSVMTGYAGEQGRTSVFHTGDTGYISEEGYIYLTGRLKNLIVLQNGKKVSPEELERRLLDCPYIHEAVVCGIEGGVYGMRISAEIYGDMEHQKEIEEYIADMEREEAPYRRLSEIRYREEPFERTKTGKIRRNR